MGDILYDCYDKNGEYIGIIFAVDCADLLRKNPNVKYVLGMDYFTRESKIHEVREAGLFPTPFKYAWELKDKEKSEKEWRT